MTTGTITTDQIAARLIKAGRELSSIRDAVEAAGLFDMEISEEGASGGTLPGCLDEAGDFIDNAIGALLPTEDDCDRVREIVDAPPDLWPAIVFDNDAGPFAAVIDSMAEYGVTIYTLDEPEVAIDAILRGSATDADWTDAVRFSRVDDGDYCNLDRPIETARVSKVVVA